MKQKVYIEWPLQESDITSEVCEACGARCCTIALPMPWTDDRKIEWFNTVVEKMEGVKALENGLYAFTCGYLGKDNKCTIYETRPQMCRDYNCVAWTKVNGQDFSTLNHVLESIGMDPIDPDKGKGFYWEGEGQHWLFK